MLIIQAGKPEHRDEQLLKKFAYKNKQFKEVPL
jgi:hypothetical protein